MSYFVCFTFLLRTTKLNIIKKNSLRDYCKHNRNKQARQEFKLNEGSNQLTWTYIILSSIAFPPQFTVILKEWNRNTFPEGKNKINSLIIILWLVNGFGRNNKLLIAAIGEILDAILQYLVKICKDNLTVFSFNNRFLLRYSTFGKDRIIIYNIKCISTVYGNIYTWNLVQIKKKYE